MTHVEHTRDAWSVATGRALPARVSAVITDAGSMAPRIAVVEGNPLAGGWSWEGLPEVEQYLVSAGTLAPAPDDAHPANWLGPGRQALDAWCAEARTTLASSSARVCLLPHARHVLSDGPSCLAFLRDHEGAFDIALAPARLLEPSMLPVIDDHLTRFVELLGPVCAAVIFEDVVADEADEICRRVAWGAGGMPRSHLEELVERHVPPGVPRIIRGEGSPGLSSEVISPEMIRPGDRP